MKKNVLKLSFMFIIAAALCSNSLFAATSLKVAILPLRVVAQQPNPQMQKKIVELIGEQLKKEGADVIYPEVELDPAAMDNSAFRKIGLENGADYILTGDVFVAGQGLSIDTRLVDVLEPEKSTVAYGDAASLEDLFSAVATVSKTLTGHIYKKKIVVDVAIEGNKRVEKDAILRLLETQPGDITQTEKISKDLKKIYDMGYFDDVVVEKESLDEGTRILFKVKEKSTVRRVEFKNNIVYDEKELSDVISTRTGSILNIHKLNSDMEKIRFLYAEENYHNCSVTYEILPLENAQADIVFTISEKNKVRVEQISFEGNHHFSDKEIKKAMETSEKGFFSWLTGSGILNEIEVKNDVIRIESLYKNNGFIDTKVSDPIIDIGKEMITVQFNIEEGSQYKLKSIDMQGDLIEDKPVLLGRIESKVGELYSREQIRKDTIALSDVYADKGYANVNVAPKIDKDESDHTMSVIYSISKGDLVYFRRVDISGNSKTRDKVIRRELRVVEQDIYSKKKIQLSYKNLNRLDYFEQIAIKPTKTDDPNLLDLDVEVTEKGTGAFSVGGGFSSSEQGFVVGSIQERNIFGTGRTVKLETKLSGESTLYNLSVFDPYIFDTRVSGGARLYKEEKEYDHYDKDATGLSLNLGYRLFDYTTVGTYYTIEDYDITNVNTTYTSMTAGNFLTSAIKPFITHDSKNDRFQPTEGMKHSFSIEYAGEFLGGDIDYTKYLAETGIWFPLFWKFTGMLHAEGGYLDDRTNNVIDIDHIRFYLGGMDSVRGFDDTDINGKRAGDTKEIGGEKYVQFNAEITFPLTEKYKLSGVFFYDRGDVYRTSEDIDLADQFSSAGIGVRWNSPLGPLRIEYGWVIDGKDVKERGDGQVEFSVGASF